MIPKACIETCMQDFCRIRHAVCLKRDFKLPFHYNAGFLGCESPCFSEMKHAIHCPRLQPLHPPFSFFPETLACLSPFRRELQSRTGDRVFQWKSFLNKRFCRRLKHSHRKTWLSISVVCFHVQNFQMNVIKEVFKLNFLWHLKGPKPN